MASATRPSAGGWDASGPLDVRVPTDVSRSDGPDGERLAPAHRELIAHVRRLANDLQQAAESASAALGDAAFPSEDGEPAPGGLVTDTAGTGSISSAADVIPSTVPPLAAAMAAMGDGVEVVIGPFVRFSELGRFLRDLRAIAGVASVDTRRFVLGMVHLRVRYHDPVPLATRLADMREFSPTIVSSAPERIEVRIKAGESSTPAR